MQFSPDFPRSPLSVGPLIGSNLVISHSPWTLVNDTSTLLDAIAGSGRSLLVVAWLTKSNTTA